MCFADNNPLNPSDHRDIIIKMKYDTQQMNIRQIDSVSGGVAWHRAHKDDILKYKELCDRAIEEIGLPRSMLQCDDLNCMESTHLDEINDLCTDLINITLESGSKCFPKCKPAGKRLAGWNNCIKPLRGDVLFWHGIWVDCDRPPAGALSMVMRSTRARNHRAVGTSSGTKQICVEQNHPTEQLMVIANISGMRLRS